MGEQFRIDPETTRTVKAKYAAIRESRNDDDVERTLAALSKAAASDRENILPYLVDCCHAYATVGEMVSRLSAGRSEEHTSELQSLMRISYAVFCLKKKK